ncbi:MAG TPA: DUF72 domain-containing protein [Verrucomicrobiae bacterium]|nr:DUF72 domain-containing protein [Verrucomicrobiae bacterium]
MSGRIFIGTSGWVYKEWANDFYRGVKPRDQFRFYATQFPTVEINATFYRMPTLETVRGWRGKAPAGFLFAVKGSRFITHIKRLNNLGRAVANFHRRIRPMREKLGPLLWQLPPNFKKDLPRLENFLRRLPKTFRHAVEFRHPEWIGPDTFELLRKYRAACVGISSLRMPMDFSVTTDFGYVRFHGLEGGAKHDYTRAELEPWARHLCARANAGDDAYVYFNNDVNVRAPDNARLLMELCGKLAVKPFAA